jgi:HEAT repeat protein
MDSPKFWEFDGYLKVDNSFLGFIKDRVFFPISKYLEDYPIETFLIFSVFLLIGLTVFLFFYVIYLRLKIDRHHNLKTRNFEIWEKIFLPVALQEDDNEGDDISVLVKTIKKSEYDLFGEFISPYLKDTKGKTQTKLINILREMGVDQRERRQLKRSNLTWRRALAAQRLGIFKDSHNIMDLVKALHDKEITVILNAAGALLKMRDHQLMKKVINVLLQNENITEELFAETLLKYGKSINLEVFLSKETYTYPIPYRLKIINLIEPIIRENSGSQLINRLENSKEALTMIFEDEYLAEELLDDIKKNIKSIDLEKFLSKKESSYPLPSRIKMIEYIGHTKRLEGVPVLLNILMRSKQDEEIISTIKALGNLEIEESSKQLLFCLESKHPVIRAQAAKALSVFKDARNTRPISRLLEDKDWWCRFYAASAIYQMGEAGREFLQNFLKSTRDSFAKDIIVQFLAKPQ